ncbi:hypothetical protein BAUCODRAFT_34605 [Baudoinia panamericana UAMH 10762]|uniref:Tetratricopeptide SHNi-TPR domain-containing protein n=1 Tax=Baudoinia panamericana (strain UAMH 10762) TaxID=717646 RepID=M2MWA7_BAUPA|nr:uncharacterized protein BAUCODRAFT_34605 [Baudoinia panamericana UAMH 10762]EMC95838.1 hypothetical protein BAUCODRAFT_34605 [Baudoinia panamericana UAMH 10762]
MAPTELRAQPTTANMDLTAKLDQLRASATQQYSLKNYSSAAEFFSEAAEVQDQINGEMVPENADLLYQYGRCLYHVAVSNSDVLGGRVTGTTEQPKRKKRKIEASATEAEDSGTGLIGRALQDVTPLAEGTLDAKDDQGPENGAGESAPKPYFNITGDENFTDEEDEDEDEEQADAAVEEEEDDFAIAYEILDVARILLGRKLEALQQQTGGEASIDSAGIRYVKERLADTHDLQAEISLENERFQDAIKDSRDALALKLDLYPQESSLIAEAHYKLSLALEFASVTSTADENGNTESKIAQADKALRAEAATEMEKAIASCKLRINKEQASLSETSAKSEERKKSIADVKDMVADMEQRLVDLRNPNAASLSADPMSGMGDGGADALKGMLGAMLGDSKAEQQKKIAEATAQANDLSGLVKHRKKVKAEEGTKGVAGAGAAAATTNGTGKRKAENVDDSVVQGKKAKIEDAQE